MQIELRKVKYAEFASEETNCFQAQVWINGQIAGDVRNDGKGGCNFYYPHSLGQQLEAHAATLPKRAASWDKNLMLSEDADTLIGTLFDEWLTDREISKLLKTRAVWQDAKGNVYNSKKFTAAKIAGLLSDPAAIDRNFTRHGYKLLNKMPYAEAKAIIVAHDAKVAAEKKEAA